MTLAETLALLAMLTGALFTLVAAVGLVRFPDALTQLHAVSKPQVLGLALILLGVVIVQPTGPVIGMMLLVLLAQMVTMPAASTMMGRTGFRRGPLQGARYAIDELSPRLADDADPDDDEDGFIDEESIDEAEGPLGRPGETFPENRVGDAHRDADLAAAANWDEPEDGRDPEPEDLDIDEDDESDEPFSADLERDDDPVESHEADPDETPTGPVRA